MTYWAEAFMRIYPNVIVQVQGAGSSTAPPALIEGTADFGAMSRKMKSLEIQAFENKYGYKPTAIPVAVDALAIFVNKDNPLNSLNLEQIDAIFSVTRSCGGALPITNWGQLGLNDKWNYRDIQRYGRNSVSGTYGFFKKTALCDGDFINRVNEQPGSASVVQAISTSLNAIGYSSIGYQTSSIKVLKIKNEQQQLITATPETTTNGRYPLSRFLYVYVNKHPNKPLPPLALEFIKFLLSDDGQKITQKDGYISLPKNVIEQFHTELELENK